MQILQTRWFKIRRNFKVASQISQSTKVRKSLLIFKETANNPPRGKGSIIDGRDIGTIIIPNAEVKFFIDANVEIRHLDEITIKA